MYRSYEGVSSATIETKLPTMEEIFAAMGYTLIKVPREPSICPIFYQPEKPELHLNKCLFDKREAFIVAGIGVVAGEILYNELFQKLKNGTLLLWWE